MNSDDLLAVMREIGCKCKAAELRLAKKPVLAAA